MPFVAEIASVARHTAHTPVIAHAALPIIPILLLPFLLVFFVLVFPVWLVATGLLSLTVLVLRGLGALVHRVRPGALDATTAKVTRARRWVWTFGGYLEQWMEGADSR